MDSFIKGNNGIEASSCAIISSAKQAERNCRIMVVDDDLTTREFLRLGMEKSGCEVVTVEGFEDAKAKFIQHGYNFFDCVVTDYQLMDGSGIDVIKWVKQNAPWLATIVITAESERNLITDSLRSGAVDFLDKPVQIPRLREAVAKAKEISRRHKYSLEVESAVKDLGRAQENLLQTQTSGEHFSVEICFHPKLEAGGDFFTRFEPAPGKLFCLLTDVSGHDLKAAYISAYFQGMVRGMLKQGAGLDAIFNYFNLVLATNWANSEGWSARTSLAACALMFDLNSKNATVLTCGIPSPLCSDGEGKMGIFGNSSGEPLGWFDELTARPCIQQFESGYTYYLWTDGLEELALMLGVSPVCLGYYLQEERNAGRRPKELLHASDDILFASVKLAGKEKPGGDFQPVVFETHHGGEMGVIDDLQNVWKGSIRLAIPLINGALEHDLILACREIVLNGMQHGCQRDPEKQMVFQIAFSKTRQLIRVCCDDPGEGHDFDFVTHEEKVVESLAGQHLGLILARHLSSSIRFERKGATVIMEFCLCKYADSDGERSSLDETDFKNNQERETQIL